MNHALIDQSLPARKAVGRWWAGCWQTGASANFLLNKKGGIICFPLWTSVLLVLAIGPKRYENDAVETYEWRTF